jgi:hypothetical protein
MITGTSRWTTPVTSTSGGGAAAGGGSWEQPGSSADTTQNTRKIDLRLIAWTSLANDGISTEGRAYSSENSMAGATTPFVPPLSGS